MIDSIFLNKLSVVDVAEIKGARSIASAEWKRGACVGNFPRLAFFIKR